MGEKGKLDNLPASAVWASSGGTSGGNPDFLSAWQPSAGRHDIVTDAVSNPQSSEMRSDDVVFIVQCLGCANPFPWEALEIGDGRCTECCLQAAQKGAVPVVAGNVSVALGAPASVPSLSKSDMAICPLDGTAHSAPVDKVISDEAPSAPLDETA